MVIDDYSRYPEVEVLYLPLQEQPDQAGCNICKTRHPRNCQPDGPPFNGCEFAAWAKFVGFQHKKITPIGPQANDESERFMRTISKAIRAAVIGKGNWTYFGDITELLQSR